MDYPPINLQGLLTNKQKYERKKTNDSNRPEDANTKKYITHGWPETIKSCKKNRAGTIRRRNPSPIKKYSGKDTSRPSRSSEMQTPSQSIWGFFWPGINKDIEWMVQECNLCRPTKMHNPSNLTIAKSGSRYV